MTLYKHEICFLISLISLFWKSKRRLMRSPRCLCVCASVWLCVYVGLGRVNSCGASPAQSFMVPSPVGLRVIFYSLTTLGVVQLSNNRLSVWPASQIAAGPCQHSHYLLRDPRDSSCITPSRHWETCNSGPSVSQSKSQVMLRPTVSWPVCLCFKPTSGARDQIFITVRQFRVCWCRASSLTGGLVWRLQLLLAFASAVILGSESRGTHNHILLSHIRHFPLYLYPPGTECPSYTPKALGSLFFASYDSQGYGWGIRTRLSVCYIKTYKENFGADRRGNKASNSWTRRFLCGPCCIKWK
jgi:hypothetical protein